MVDFIIGKYLAIVVIILSTLYIMMHMYMATKQRTLEQLSEYFDDVDAVVDNELEEIRGTMSGHLSQLDTLLETNDKLDTPEYMQIIKQLDDIKDSEIPEPVAEDTEGYSHISSHFQEY